MIDLSCHILVKNYTIIEEQPPELDHTSKLGWYGPIISLQQSYSCITKQKSHLTELTENVS